MKPLVANKHILTWLCVYPMDESTKGWQKMAYFGFTATLLIGNVSFLLCAAAFISKFISTDLEGSLYSFFQFIAYTGSTYTQVFAFFFRHEIKGLFEKLSKIYDENENDESFRFFVHANNKSTRVWRVHFKFAIGIYIVNTVLMTCMSVWQCQSANGQFDWDLVYHQDRTIMPWNQTSPMGYFGETWATLISGTAYYVTTASILFLFCSICWHHRAFYQRIEYTLHKLDAPDKNRNDKALLCDLIQFHISIKDWFMDSTKIYSYIVLVQLGLSMIHLACCIAQLDLKFQNNDYDITLVVIAALCGATNLFVYCFFGKMATDSYGKISYCLFESRWRSLTVELQKYFVLIIGNANRPLVYHGLGITVLNLETFTKLLKMVISYYMMFKAVASN